MMRVLYANLVIFLYTLPLNALSIALLYGVTTMALSEMTHTQVPLTPSHSLPLSLPLSLARSLSG